MRNLILLLLGIAVGAAGAASIVDAMNKRDAYARGVMNVMQHHLGSLRDGVRRGQCGDQTAADLERLRTLASEIDSAVYPDDIPDAPFREYSGKLRDILQQTPDRADCPTLKTFAEKIGATCDECHRQYR